MSEATRTTDRQLSHTPGPWRWEVNLKSRVISLRGGNRPLYDWTVMDFVRWGMGNAQPRFMVNGLLCKAEDFKRIDPQREHHKAWFQLLSHPDADVIAAAPDLFEAVRLLVECKDVKDRLDGWEAGSTQEMAAMAEWYDVNKPKAWEMARAAVAKAEGRS